MVAVKKKIKKLKTVYEKEERRYGNTYEKENTRHEYKHDKEMGQAIKIGRKN